MEYRRGQKHQAPPYSLHQRQQKRKPGDPEVNAKIREFPVNAARGPGTRIIAVTSGKGGVGKTNVVANLR